MELLPDKDSRLPKFFTTARSYFAPLSESVLADAAPGVDLSGLSGGSSRLLKSKERPHTGSRSGGVMETESPHTGVLCAQAN